MKDKTQALIDICARILILQGEDAPKLTLKTPPFTYAEALFDMASALNELVAERRSSSDSQWTKNSPTEPGEYWFWEPGLTKPILLTAFQHEQGLAVHWSEKMWVLVNILKGYWMRAVRPTLPQFETERKPNEQ